MLYDIWKLKIDFTLKLAPFWDQPSFSGPSSDCNDEQHKNVTDTQQNSQEKWLQRSASCQNEKTDPNLETAVVHDLRTKMCSALMSWTTKKYVCSSALFLTRQYL